MPKTYSRGLEPSGFTIRTMRFFHLCPMVTSFWRPRDFRIFTKNDHFLRHFFIFMHRNFIFRFFGASKMEGTFCLFLVYVAVVHTTPPTTPQKTRRGRFLKSLGRSFHMSSPATVCIASFFQRNTARWKCVFSLPMYRKELHVPCCQCAEKGGAQLDRTDAWVHPNGWPPFRYKFYRRRVLNWGELN